jgi:hypothetical protein
VRGADGTARFPRHILTGPHPTFAYAKATFSRFAGEGDAFSFTETISGHSSLSAASLRNEAAPESERALHRVGRKFEKKRVFQTVSPQAIDI